MMKVEPIKKTLALVVFFVLVCVPKSIFADLGQHVKSSNYFERASSRFSQGLVNFSFGWSSLILEPAKSFRKGDPSVGEGFFRGLAYPISYTVLGAWDICTFWVPGPEKLGEDIAGVNENVFNL